MIHKKNIGTKNKNKQKQKYQIMCGNTNWHAVNESFGSIFRSLRSGFKAISFELILKWPILRPIHQFQWLID